jgi:hypothetical protein
MSDWTDESLQWGRYRVYARSRAEECSRHYLGAGREPLTKVRTIVSRCNYMSVGHV